MKRLRDKESTLSWLQWRWNRVRDVSLLFFHWGDNNNNTNTEHDIDAQQSPLFLPKDVTDALLCHIVVPLYFHHHIHLEHTAWPTVHNRYGNIATLSFYTENDDHALKGLQPTHHNFDFSGGPAALQHYIMTHYAPEGFTTEKGWKPNVRYCTRRIGCPYRDSATMNELCDEQAFIDMMTQYERACSVLDEHPSKHLIHVTFSISMCVTKTTVKYYQFNKERMTS